MNDGISSLPVVAPATAQTSRGDLERQLSSSSPDEAAEKMEALFATLLVKEMRRALPNGFFGQGAGSDTFDGWLDEHLGKALADSDALGLAGEIRVSLERKLEAQRQAAGSGDGPAARPQAEAASAAEHARREVSR